jgi:hypothetical protein
MFVKSCYRECLRHFFDTHARWQKSGPGQSWGWVLQVLKRRFRECGNGGRMR